MNKIYIKTDAQSDEHVIDKCLWDEILIHYIDLYKKDVDIGECFSLININLHKRSRKVASSDRIIDRLTEINKLYSYVRDISDTSALHILKIANTDSVSIKLIEHLSKYESKKCNLIDFLNEVYGADFKRSDLAVDVWTKMRPLSDEGKARGYSGPAEMPLLMFAGGYKAEKGDIRVDNQIIEVKGDGGRIGEASDWSTSRANIEKFINQFNTAKEFSESIQYEFDFGDISAPFASKFDTSMLPHWLSAFARTLNVKHMLNDRADAILFIGTAQLLEYLSYKKDDWFILFKHPGKTTVPFGTTFTLNSKNIAVNVETFRILFKSLRDNNISFSPCYDSSGYKIKFLK